MAGLRPADPEPVVEALDASAYAAAIPDLADLLVDAVDGGAGVNFMAGLAAAEAAAWWAERGRQVADGTITPFVVRDRSNGRIVGSTLLIRMRNPNAPHRAEIAKVLVHRSVRRRGLGRALMAAAEVHARADGRWLLVLDTFSGSEAETLYRTTGWQELGTLPNHSYHPDGALGSAVYFWKDLRDAT